MLPVDRSIVGGALIVLAMVVTAVLGRRERLVILGLFLLSLAWFGIDNQWNEGEVLLPVAPHHGITVADLPGVAGLVVVVLLLWRRRTQRRDSGPR